MKKCNSAVGLLVFPVVLQTVFVKLLFFHKPGLTLVEDQRAEKHSLLLGPPPLRLRLHPLLFLSNHRIMTLQHLL